MDILKLIQNKVQRFSGTPFQQGLESVIHHIEIAEKHHERGKKENSDFLFTDVLYRTNHAFEGILKEAYSLLTGQDPNQKTSFQIEQYLDTNKILRARVLKLFANYRTEWRNPSTHDYQLFFSEQEAFLSIINICAFVSILLDQLLEKIAFDREKENVVKSGIKPISKSKNYGSLGLLEAATKLAKNYSMKFPYPEDGRIQVTENELLGGLSAFIEYSDKDIKTYREPLFEIDNQKLQVDLLLHKGEERIIIELKKTRKNIIKSDVAEDQIISYLSATNIENGILLFIPDRPAKSMKSEIIERKIGNVIVKVVKIYPEV